MRRNTRLSISVLLLLSLFLLGLACSQSASPPGSPPQSVVVTGSPPPQTGLGAVPPLESENLPASTSTPVFSPTSEPIVTGGSLTETPASTSDLNKETPAPTLELASETATNLPSPSISITAQAEETVIESATSTIQIPAIDTERLVLSDEFNGGGAWAQGSVEGSFEFGYTTNTYQFIVQEPNLDVWSIRGQSYFNLRQDLLIASFAGASDGFTGVVCRWNGSNNYYRLTVDASGVFKITRVFSAEVVDLGTTTGPSLSESAEGQYRLRAECNGDFLSLYLNDALMVWVQDDFFQEGNFGIVTGTLENSPFTAELNSFALYLP